MDALEQGQALHDRATRGLPLSLEEQAQLEHWYAVQDEEEGLLRPTRADERSLQEIRASVEGALQQLQHLSARIQELEQQNEAVRSENAALQQRLARSPVAGKP